MALTDENGIGATMLMQPAGGIGYPYPMYGGNNNGGLFGNGDSWLGILFLIALCNGGFGFGGGFGGWGAMGMMNGMYGMGIDYLYPWLNNSEHISDGFRDQQLSTQVGNIQNSITSGFGDVQNALCSGFGNVQTSLCSGFAGVNASINGAQNAIAQQMYGNEIASLERSYAAQTASTQGMSAIQAQLAQCCCDNRAATQDVKYTIATEACNTRAANTANTQAILDKLCALELDGYKRENDNLRTQLNMANLAASQTAQTATILQGQAAEIDGVYNRLKNCPVGTVPVFGNQPIFTCAQNVAGSNCGCGCGSF